MVGKNLIVTRLDNQNVDLRKPVSFKEAEKEVFFFWSCHLPPNSNLMTVITVQKKRFFKRKLFPLMAGRPFTSSPTPKKRFLRLPLGWMY